MYSWTGDLALWRCWLLCWVLLADRAALCCVLCAVQWINAILSSHHVVLLPIFRTSGWMQSKVMSKLARRKLQALSLKTYVTLAVPILRVLTCASVCLWFNIACRCHAAPCWRSFETRLCQRAKDRGVVIRRVSESRSTVTCHCCGQYHYGLGGSKTFVCPTPTCPMHHVEVHRDEKAALSTLLHNWSDSVVVVQVPVPVPLPVGAGAGAGVRASAAVAV